MNLSALYLFAVLLFVPAFVESQTLTAPRNLQIITPNQRSVVKVSWQNPAGLFYPSYNLYYTSSADSIVHEVTGISAFTYTITTLNSGVTYSIQVTGVLNGQESPKSNSVSFTTSAADPKINPSLGISTPNCTVDSVNDVTCGWTLGTVTYKQINVRIKCPKGVSGAPWIRNKYIRHGTTTSFTINLNQWAGKTCKIFFHVMYVQSNSPPSLPNLRFSRKMKGVRVTLNPAQF